MLAIKLPFQVTLAAMLGGSVLLTLAAAGPVPAAPRAAPDIAALPQPATARALDLGALAQGYTDHAERIEAAQRSSPGAALLVFVSFTMPAATLERLVDQAARTQATLVVRGLINGSLRETVARIQQAIGRRTVAFQIDPQAFDRFAIVKTPTFVLVRAGAQGQPCGTGQCMPPHAFVATSGDVSLAYALRFIARQAPGFAREARRSLARLGG